MDLEDPHSVKNTAEIRTLHKTVSLADSQLRIMKLLKFHSGGEILPMHLK